MTIRNDPRYAGDPNAPDPDRHFPDEKARKAARLATILAALALLLALIALIVALVHDHDFAPQNCDPATDYVCKPEVKEEKVTTQVPTTSMSPTEVPVPTVTESETVTTTVVP
jgi:hypothetical protein